MHPRLRWANRAHFLLWLLIYFVPWWHSKDKCLLLLVVLRMFNPGKMRKLISIRLQAVPQSWRSISTSFRISNWILIKCSNDSQATLPLTSHVTSAPFRSIPLAQTGGVMASEEDITTNSNIKLLLALLSQCIFHKLSLEVWICEAQILSEQPRDACDGSGSHLKMAFSACSDPP